VTSSATLERIETARLVCERLRLEHLPESSQLLQDSRVGATLWPRQAPPTERDILDKLLDKERHWERYGFGLWLLRDRSTREAVGRGGLQWTYVSGLNEVEAAWAIVPERWRQGLATELAQAAIDVAFGPLARREIIAFTLPDNIASRRVMEKTLFEYERDIVHVSLRHVLYRRRAET
jgi:RimJ/RimL family protein N-acetyltransferase